RSLAEEVSHQDLKWLFGQWLHGTPLIDYRLDKVQRRRLADGRWLTAVNISRQGDGLMPVESADKDTIYARSTGQPERERVEFVTARKPGRLVLDPRQRAHDWNALNNREKRSLFGSRALNTTRIDNPTKTPMQRDRIVTSLLPLLWYNDYGGVTGAVRARSNYLGRFNKNLALASYGFDAIWMAVSDLGYVDRRLWDDAGTIEAGPWASVTSRHGDKVWRARAGVRGGVVYRNPGAGVQSSNRYDIEGFARITSEVSLRSRFLGIRLFGGTYLAETAP